MGPSGPSISARLHFLLQSRTQRTRTGLSPLGGSAADSCRGFCGSTSPVFSQNSCPGAARRTARTCIYYFFFPPLASANRIPGCWCRDVAPPLCCYVPTGAQHRRIPRAAAAPLSYYGRGRYWASCSAQVTKQSAHAQKRRGT